ncbi:MAG: hypothetical protein QF569_29815, partial [Candidatus Poribacteria bacterium]|nr:hypothetical protein [Candidatus Poribacteria bacterium]
WHEIQGILKDGDPKKMPPYLKDAAKSYGKWLWNDSKDPDILAKKAAGLKQGDTWEGIQSQDKINGLPEPHKSVAQKALDDYKRKKKE